MSPCSVSSADLVAYLDHELRGARREYVDAHVRGCSFCQERLATLQQTTKLLQTATPIVDDPVGRAQAKARITHEAVQCNRVVPNRALMALAAALLIMLVLFASPGMRTQASFHFRSLVERKLLNVVTDQKPGTIFRASQLPGAPVAQPGAASSAPIFGVVVPPTLPDNLYLSSFAQSRPDRAELRYLGPNHLQVNLLEEHLGQTQTTISPPYELVIIRGTEVLWNVSPLVLSITRAVWTRHDIQFDLNVVSWSGPGLSPDTARQIIERLLTAQENAGT